MIRTIIKPDTQSINLSIPVEYIGKEVEILIFPVDSLVNITESINDADEQHNRRQEAFKNFIKYKGTLPVDFDYKKELDEYLDGRYAYTD